MVERAIANRVAACSIHALVFTVVTSIFFQGKSTKLLTGKVASHVKKYLPVLYQSSQAKDRQLKGCSK